MIKYIFAFAILLSSAVSMAASDSFLYINYAPDIRYTIDEFDSRITLDLKNELYGYGHSYGETQACATNSDVCVSFDFMALFRLPKGATLGSQYSEGDYQFTVSRLSKLSLLGVSYDVLFVDVKKGKKHTNSYFWEPHRGVVAIVAGNFENTAIPRSVFFLEGSEGVFAQR